MTPFEEAAALLSKITPGEWIAEDRPPNGWTVFWRVPDGPICHMRWTDGMRSEVEQRIEAEAKFIAAAPRLLRALLDEQTQLRRVLDPDNLHESLVVLEIAEVVTLCVREAEEVARDEMNRAEAAEQEITRLREAQTSTPPG